MEIRFISSTHVRAMADAELPLPVARATDLSGRVLGSRYSLRRRIGGGSMGTVYEARDMTLGTAVAVKVLHPDYAGDADFRRRFHQEALLGARMRHEHSVAVTDLGETDDGLFYSVMEYLEGESLDGLLSSSQGPLPWRRVVTITVQVCAALQAAHERGVIHRDIKPGNCFLLRHERSGRGGNEDDDPNFTYVKVLDLGLARLMPAGGRPTPPGRLGAPEYLAPEQVQGFTCDHRVDLYAIGVMMYKLLTRRLPFTGDSPAAIMKMHIEAAPTPPRRAAPGADIPASLEAVVLRALAKSPADRFPDAKGMAEAVRAAAAEAEAEAVAIDESIEEAPTLGRSAGLSAASFSDSRSTTPGASRSGASRSSGSSTSRSITAGAAASRSSGAATSRSSGSAASRSAAAATSRSAAAATSRAAAHPIGTRRLPLDLLGLLLALASILVVALTTLVEQRAEQQRALARIEPPPVSITAPVAPGAPLRPSPTTLAASATALASPSTLASTAPTLAAPAPNGTAFASGLGPTPASITTGLAAPTAEPAVTSASLPSLASPGPLPRHGLSERTARHDAAASPRTPGTPSERVFQRLADTVAPGVYRCMQRHAPGQGVLTVELTVGGPRRSAVALGLREHDSPDLRGCLAPLLARLSFPPTEHTARYAHVYKP